MNLFLVPFCVLCIIGEGLCANIFKERKREGFSIIGLPFKYHKIVSDFIDYAPKELLQVCLLIESDICRFFVMKRTTIPYFLSHLGELAQWSQRPFGQRANPIRNKGYTNCFMGLQSWILLHPGYVRL